MNPDQFRTSRTFPLSATPQPQQQTRAEAESKLRQAVGGSREVLVSATTVFPFTLFPDTITIDRTKMTIAHRTFFQVAEVSSFNVDDILNVAANVGPFFGSLSITTRFFEGENKPCEVKYLWREDALRIKRILQGYVIAVQKRIDCSHFSRDELVRMLNQLGGSEDR